MRKQDCCLKCTCPLWGLKEIDTTWVDATGSLNRKSLQSNHNKRRFGYGQTLEKNIINLTLILSNSRRLITQRPTTIFR